jgi:RNA 2',3'-cyclic 3'-phosphodiesterase
MFVALVVPSDVVAALAAAVADWRDRACGAEARLADGLRWTRPDGWHVTVAFLGEVGEDEVDSVAPVVRAAVDGTPAPTLRLGRPRRFGSRVLHVAVDDAPPGALAHLGATVQASMEAAGLPVQRREVQGHLTLARSTRQARVERVPAIDVPAASWRAGSLAVQASRPQRGGARYTTLAEVPLDGGR